MTRLRNQYIALSDPNLFRQKGYKYISIRAMYHRNKAGANRKLPEGVDVPDESLWRSDGTVEVLVPEAFVPGLDFDDENASLGSLRADAVAVRPADSANMNRTQCPVNPGGRRPVRVHVCCSRRRCHEDAYARQAFHRTRLLGGRI